MVGLVRRIDLLHSDGVWFLKIRLGMGMEGVAASVSRLDPACVHIA